MFGSPLWKGLFPSCARAKKSHCSFFRFELAPAHAADVVSSNIVGYEKITLNAGWNMLGIQFVQVGQGEAMDLSTFAALNPEMAGFDEDGNFATELQVWNGLGYDMFGWSGSSGTDVLDTPDLDNKWLNGDLEESDGTVLFGHGVWIKTDAAGTITFTNPAQ